MSVYLKVESFDPPPEFVGLPEPRVTNRIFTIWYDDSVKIADIRRAIQNSGLLPEGTRPDIFFTATHRANQYEDEDTIGPNTRTIICSLSYL